VLRRQEFLIQLSLEQVSLRTQSHRVLDIAGVRRALQGNETVLVVEDEKPVRELTVRMLRQLGYSLADTGLHAVPAISTPPARLLISVQQSQSRLESPHPLRGFCPFRITAFNPICYRKARLSHCVVSLRDGVRRGRRLESWSRCGKREGDN
jgi:hypothetical protein